MYAFAIWVTTDCNMKCSYCYEGNEKENSLLRIGMADKIISFIAEKIGESTDMIIIEFHGGEPLLNFPIIKYIVEKLENEYPQYKIIYGITTNGTICTPEIIKFLSSYCTYSLTVSIDGTEVAHNSNRILKNGAPTYNLALETAKMLQEVRPDVRIRMTVVPNNLKELADGIIQFVNMGFKIIVPVLDYFNHNWKKKDIDLIAQMLRSVKNYIEGNTKFSDVQIAMISDQRKSLGHCGGGNNSFHIVPNGDIYPCAYSVGNEAEKIGSIMSGIDQKKIQLLNDIYCSTNTECEGCGNYEACISSRCKFLNRSVTGEYNKPIPLICAMENMKMLL